MTNLNQCSRSLDNDGRACRYGPHHYETLPKYRNDRDRRYGYRPNNFYGSTHRENTIYHPYVAYNTKTSTQSFTNRSDIVLENTYHRD